jgi:hypothetical protein
MQKRVRSGLCLNLLASYYELLRTIIFRFHEIFGETFTPPNGDYETETAKTISRH